MKSTEESDFASTATSKSHYERISKDGFRWLATMDRYGFGGILADDMGLGKTLQIISLLLLRRKMNKIAESYTLLSENLRLNHL